MLPALLGIALLAPQEAGYRRDDVFVFPRPVLKTGVRTEGIAPTDTEGSDPDFARAIDDLIRTVHPAIRNNVEFGWEMGFPDVAYRSSILDEILSDAAAGSDMRRPATRPLDTFLMGYWQSGYRFSLSGLLLGFRKTLYSSIRSEADYQTLRGYWEDYEAGRIFWGVGVRMRFRLEGTGPSLFTRSHYKTRSYLRKDGHVYEFYGVAPDDKLAYGPVFESKSLPQTLENTLDSCDARFESRFHQGAVLVEPIFIQLRPKSAQDYRNTVRPDTRGT